LTLSTLVSRPLESLNANNITSIFMEPTDDSQNVQRNVLAWTFARDRLIEHVKKINHGAFGGVHIVSNTVETF